MKKIFKNFEKIFSWKKNFFVPKNTFKSSHHKKVEKILIKEKPDYTKLGLEKLINVFEELYTGDFWLQNQQNLQQINDLFEEKFQPNKRFTTDSIYLATCGQFLRNKIGKNGDWYCLV